MSTAIRRSKCTLAEKQKVSGTKRKKKTTTKKKRKSKKKSTKDPNAPKRPKTSYLIFSMKARPQVHKEMPTLSFADLSREVGRRWKALSPQEQAKFAPPPSKTHVVIDPNKGTRATKKKNATHESDESSGSSSSESSSESEQEDSEAESEDYQRVALEKSGSGSSSNSKKKNKSIGSGRSASLRAFLADLELEDELVAFVAQDVCDLSTLLLLDASDLETLLKHLTLGKRKKLLHKIQMYKAEDPTPPLFSAPPASSTSSCSSSINTSTKIRECVVCLDNEAAMIILPCFHLVLCSVCGPKFTGGACPSCRTRIVEIRQTY